MMSGVAIINRCSQWLLDLPIRIKLMLMITGVCTLTLILVSIMFISHDYSQSRDSLVQEMSTLSRIVANRSTAALVYDDRRVAEENLRALSAEETIMLACIYDPDGVEFAYFSQDSDVPSCPTWVGEETHYFDADALHIFQPVILADMPIGSIYLKASLHEIQYNLFQYILFAALFVPIAVIIAYLLSAALQGILTDPILHLVRVSRNVTDRNDYSVRATEYTRDEIGQLIHSFNEMLERIQARDSMLVESKIAAETANRAKSQFLANINHELRTPLNAIIGFSEIIKNEVMGELGNNKYRSYIKDIYNAGVHLLSVINDILDFSKAEAGEMTVRAHRVDVCRTIKAMVRLISPRARESNIRLERQFPDEVIELYTDEKKLKQILLNLLSNAVKFTNDGGKVIVKAEHNKETGEVVIEIIDNGIGIAEEDMETVLMPFGQVDSDLNRHYEGTGLGLPISRKFVEVMGGQFEIESQPGKGTTVRVRLMPYTSTSQVNEMGAVSIADKEEGTAFKEKAPGEGMVAADPAS